MKNVRLISKKLIIKYAALIASCTFVFIAAAANSVWSAAVDTNYEEYDFIPSSSFIDIGDTADTIRGINTNDPSAIELIWGDHFVKLQVGDTMPSGVYVAKDGSKCYIIDKKADGTKIKTTYNISGADYNIELVETIK